HDFHMGDWQPDSVVDVQRGFARTSVYLWIVPAQVDGFWHLEIDGGESYALELEQEFQRGCGAVRGAGVVRPLDGARLRGERIKLGLVETMEGLPRRIRLSGVVGEEEMHGTLAGPLPGATRGWRAVRST